MAFPDYVPTRTVTVPGAASVEDPAVGVRVSLHIQSSHALRWAATGYDFERTGIAVTSAPGAPLSVELPRTDVDGWQDAGSGDYIDVSGPGAYTHEYTATLRYGNNGRTISVGPFTLPEGEEPVDLTALLPVGTTRGNQVLVPDRWTGQVSAIESELAGRLSEDSLSATIDGAVTEGLVSPFTGSAFGTGVKLGVDPANYAPSTNLNGLDLSIGAGAITVQSANGTTVFGVTASGDALGVLSGTSSPTLAHFDAAPVRGGEPYKRVLRVVIGALNAIGSANSLGGFSGGVLAGPAVSFFRWNLATASRVYLLQKATGATLSSLTTPTLVTTTTVAQVGDVVDLEVQAKYVRLIVNGVVVAEQPLVASEQETFRVGDRAGVIMQPSSTPAGAFASFGLVDTTATTGAATRSPVSVDAASFKLPPQVQFDSQQIAQVRDAVVPGRRDIRQFGAKVDGQVISVATTGGSATITPAGYMFKAADVGKAIAVRGAGPIVANANDGVWLGTISAVNEAFGTATMSSTATATVAGAECVFGTPDDDAISRAGQECWLNGGGEVYFPPGITIVTKPYRVRNFTSFAGEHRDLSKVYVLQNTVGGGNWLFVTGVNEANPITGVYLRRFTVNAWAMFNTGSWTATIKPLNLFHVKNCAAVDMAVIDSPATALPFDHAQETCVLAFNLIIRPGRLAPVGVGPGGSGIGLGTQGVGDADPTLVFGNSIIGSVTASFAGVGNNAIFVEAQSGASPDTGTVGYRILANYIEGMPVGISDQGSSNTIIALNEIRGCTIGIRIRESDLGNSSPGRYTHVDGNQIIGCTGPGVNDGIGILVSTAGDNTSTTAKVFAKITDNTIVGCKSEGVVLEAEFTDMVGVTLRGNDIRDCGLSGVKIKGSKVHRFLSITHNQIASNGRRGTVGDQAAVLVASGASMTGGRIQDNDWYDLETVPTQTAGLVSTGATLTNVTTTGNTT